MIVLASVAELRRQVAGWRAEGHRIALVPTMGALHEGHLALVRRARELAARVVVSIFVNPSQFGPNEDFAAYPRRHDADGRMLEETGAHGLYLPPVEAMYPQGFATTVSVAGVSEGLCGEVRPGHFAGVATVVTKLFLQAAPDIAVFGEKDYQQLQVIRRLAADLDIPVEVVGLPTVRDVDGLALSSRNAYLTSAERVMASALPATLAAVAARLAEVQGGGIAYRYGGEEFAVLFPGRSIDEAAKALEDLRASVDGYHMRIRSDDRPRDSQAGSQRRTEPGVEVSRDKVLSVTISIGVAALADQDATLAGLMARADAALYEAKRTGRDKVVAASSIRAIAG